MPARGRVSLVSVINPIVPLILRFWRRICLVLILFVFTIIPAIYFLFVLPIEISDAHEADYLRRIQHFEYEESLDRWSPSLKGIIQNDPTPMHERPTRMFQDVIQLTSENWSGSMALYPDGTCQYPMQSFWIYVGGTARNMSEPLWKRTWRRMAPFRLPGGSCVDPPEMCDAYNAAFQQLVDDARARKFAPTSRGLWRFMDCDNTPALCDNFQLDPVMVIRVEVPEGGCRSPDWPIFSFACNVKWSYIGLPLKRLPFERKMRLDDGRLVPAFPSAYEELYQIIMLHEGLDALEVFDPPYVEWANVTDETLERYVKSEQPPFGGVNPEDEEGPDVDGLA